MRGRKKSVEKTRVRTIKLTTKANFYLEKIKQLRPLFDFSRYISEHIINDFGENTEGYLKFEISEINKQIDELRKMQDQRIKEIRIIQEKRLIEANIL